jgi:hypothetical protein
MPLASSNALAFIMRTEGQPILQYIVYNFRVLSFFLKFSVCAVVALVDRQVNHQCRKQGWGFRSLSNFALLDNLGVSKMIHRTKVDIISS